MAKKGMGPGMIGALLFGGTSLTAPGCLTIIVIILVGGMLGIGLKGDTDQKSGDAGELTNPNALTEKQIQDLLTNKISTGYNLKGFAKQIHDAGHKFNINPLFALAIANKDSSLGTAGAGKTCRNPGNMEHRSDNFKLSGITGIGDCQSAYGGSSRWQAFRTYGDGMQAKMWLLRKNYIDKNLTTLPQIIGRYCPASECNVSQYVEDVENFMKKYGGMY